MRYLLCSPGGDRELQGRDGRNMSLRQGATLSPMEKDKKYSQEQSWKSHQCLSSCFHEGRTTARDLSLFLALPGAFCGSLAGIMSSAVSTNFSCGAGLIGTA